MALGIVAVCLGALGSFYLFTMMSESHQVVAVRRAVPRGAVLGSGDLTLTSVGSMKGIATVDGGRLAGLVGRRTAVQLVPDTLLPPDAVAADPLPAAHRTIVGVRLPDGRAPAGFLEPGSPVRLVAVTSASAETRTNIKGNDPGTGPAEESVNVAVSARVVETRSLSDGQSILLDADVPDDQAAMVARLAATDRLVCVRDAEG